MILPPQHTALSFFIPSDLAERENNVASKQYYSISNGKVIRRQDTLSREWRENPGTRQFGSLLRALGKSIDNEGLKQVRPGLTHYLVI